MARPGRLHSLLYVGFVAAATQSARAQDSAAPSELNPRQLIGQIVERCRPWLVQPASGLRSLKYTYHLGNDERAVELVAGVSRVRRGMWQGATLFTGLHAAAAAPDQYVAEAARIDRDAERDDPFIRLTARPVDAERPFHIEAGNGVDGSWRGYFSHSSAQMQVDLDPESLLPLREIHQHSQFEYRDWQEVGDDLWAPRLIVVRTGDAAYRMHFAWQGNAVWLLTHAEIARGERTTPIARVTDVVVNDEAIIAEQTAEQRRQEEARQIIRDMLARNCAWLAPQPSFDALQFTFHTERQDVKETAAVRRDGLTAFEVAYDGLGEMSAQLGERKIVLPDGRVASARRGEARAMVQDASQDDRGPNFGEQLRRYALMGCQLDLPLFELSRVLDGASVEIADGQWNGAPCHVATISVPGRSGYLGCGVMLGFTSWSYVHHLYPAYEVIYIDKERLVPVHETFVSSRGDRQFDVDFGDYAPVETGEGQRLVPLGIELASKDYFTCRYDFQIVADRHWLLKSVESWFSPDEKSRGVVMDVQIDESSELLAEAERQVAAYRGVFDEEPGAAAPADDDSTLTVAAVPFELGRPLKIGASAAIFTLDAKEELIVRCTGEPESGSAAGQRISVLLLDDADRLLQAAEGAFAVKNGRLEATASFGNSVALGETARFVIAGAGDVSQVAGIEQRRLRGRRLAPADQTPAAYRIADAAGNTRLIDAELRRNAASQLVAAVRFASRDRMNEFALDASVALFDKTGRLAAAASKRGSVRVESRIVEETWEVVVPTSAPPEEVGFIAVGLSRGQTISAPFGTLWGSFARYSPFSTDALIGADDPGCWTAGLARLEDEIDESLDHGILGSDHRWRDQIAEHETPADLLKGRVDRLRSIVDLATEPPTLASALRLLGHSGDVSAVARAEARLEHVDDAVQDAAAIALGLLGRDEGMARLEAILARPRPGNDDPGVRDDFKTKRLARLALATVRSDASIPLVRKWLLAYVDGVRIVETERGSSRADGTSYELEQFALLLGRRKDPRYVGLLIEAVERLESREELGRYADVGELLAAMLNYGNEARPFLETRIRRGDPAAISALRNSNDNYYVPAVRAMFQTDGAGRSWYNATTYLWNIGSPAAVDALRDAYDRGVPNDEDSESTRLRLAEALAYLGDGRGLSDALVVLVELAQPATPPDGKEQRKEWQDERDDVRDAALRVFDRAGTATVVGLLVEHAGDNDPAMRQALLQILERLHSLPDAVRPAVERWAADASSEAIARQATRLLARHR